MNSTQRIFETTIAVSLLILLSGCNCKIRHPLDVYRNLENTKHSDRDQFIWDNIVEIHHYEKELLLVAKEEIFYDNFNSQDVAVCILFAIVEPDQEDPPKAYLVSDLEERFRELYTIHGDDNVVGLAAEKFLFRCFEESRIKGKGGQR